MRKRIYIAGCYEKKKQLYEHAKELQRYGFELNCSWLWLSDKKRLRNHQETELALAPPLKHPIDTELKIRQAAKIAEYDMEEIRTSNIFILDTEQLNDRGGKEVEFGAAYASGLLVCIVGEPRNIFHYLPGIIHYPEWFGLIKSFGAPYSYERKHPGTSL